MELRCEGQRLHAHLDTEMGTLEVKCDSKDCRPSKDVVVLHTFDTTTGELLSTRKFQNPSNRKDTPA